MILTDGVHVVSTDSSEELHNFASSIGLKRCWYEGVRRGHPHYDLPQYMQKSNIAVTSGAVTVSSKDIVTRNYVKKSQSKIDNALEKSNFRPYSYQDTGNGFVIMYEDTDFGIVDSKEDAKVIVDDANAGVFYIHSSVKKKAEMFDRIFEGHKDNKPVCFCSVCQIYRTMWTNDLMDEAVGRL